MRMATKVAATCRRNNVFIIQGTLKSVYTEFSGEIINILGGGSIDYSE